MFIMLMILVLSFFFLSLIVIYLSQIDTTYTIKPDAISKCGRGVAECYINTMSASTLTTKVPVVVNTISNTKTYPN